MADQLRNNVKVTISNSPGTSGAFTVSTASTGCLPFVAGDDGLTFSVRAYESGVGSEFRTGCTYTHSGTSLSRGTLEQSSSGAALNFTSAATVEVVSTAAWGNRNTIALQALIPGGRLTLESGVPVPTTDQTAKTSIYYCPYQHDVIVLWNGSEWVPVTFTEKTLALGTLTSALPYDVFGYLSSGALVLESLAWTDATNRATAVTLQDGRYCKSGDKTRLYLGTFYTTSTTTTEDSGFGSTTAPSKRYLWNAYNRVKRTVFIEEDTASWTWTGTAATWRQWRAQTDNQVEAVVGLPGASNISLECNCTHGNATINSSSAVGIGYDSTTVLAANATSFFGESSRANANGPIPVHAHLEQVVPVGRHYWAMLEENTQGGAVVVTMYGTSAAYRRSGMVGWVEA